MKFSIDRTTVYDAGQPCEEARQETHDVPTCILPCETRGRWHTEPRQVWVVDLDSLEALVAFAEKYGQLIVSSDPVYPIPQNIEIYDDFKY